MSKQPLTNARTWLPRWRRLIEFAEARGVKLTPTQAKTILKREKTIGKSRDFIVRVVKAHQKKTLNGKN